MPATRVKPDELLDELVALYLAEGFRHFTLAELAARTHRSKSTLYSLGQSKERVTVSVVRHFFHAAAVQVEEQTLHEGAAADRLGSFLTAIGHALRPASPDFMNDLASHDAAAEVYERRTSQATERMRGIVSEGTKDGEFRDVPAAFVADTIATAMRRIQAGDVLAATGISDAEAYEELAALVLDGIRGI